MNIRGEFHVFPEYLATGFCPTQQRGCALRNKLIGTPVERSWRIPRQDNYGLMSRRWWSQ
jgi:hypothetical protein